MIYDQMLQLLHFNILFVGVEHSVLCKTHMIGLKIKWLNKCNKGGNTGKCNIFFSALISLLSLHCRA
jgi:hypothetical protein